MSYIKNRDALLNGKVSPLRRVALDVAEKALESADPGLAAKRLISLRNDELWVGEKHFALNTGGRIFVIGTGKATFPVAKVLDDLLGARIHKGFVACKNGQEGSLGHIELHRASHPIPDESSVISARRTMEILQEVKPGDIVLACVSGGSSSLFVCPVDGVSLEDKARTSHILLTCGANIIEINAVRKHISQVKGGRLIKNLPAGAHLINLTVSDVIGDPLDYITDLTVPDTSTFADARRTLDKYDLWDKLPAAVTAYLRRAPVEDETAKTEDLAHIDRTDIILQKADAACTGAAAAAREAGFTPMLLSTFFEGESAMLGRAFTAIARQILHDGSPLPAPCVLIGGGETTVTFSGDVGKGGPNQEFATAAALDLRDMQGVVALALDTDGTDGPTDFAGGMVDGTTAADGKAQLLDEALRRHNVSPALEQCGALILTGNTGTNVNDLKLVFVASADKA